MSQAAGPTLSSSAATSTRVTDEESLSDLAPSRAPARWRSEDRSSRAVLERSPRLRSFENVRLMFRSHCDPNSRAIRDSPVNLSKLREGSVHLEGEVIFLQRIVSNTEGARRRPRETRRLFVVRPRKLPLLFRYHAVTFCE